MSHPHHHQHTRKQAEDEFPHSVDWKRWLDNLVIWLGVGNIIATIPQVLEIWVGKEAAGVSTASWAYYTFFSFVFTIYGIVHKEFPIIITYSFSVILYALIFIGSVIY